MKRIIPFSVVIIMVVTGICQSQTIDTPYVVGAWRGFSSAAVSFTFDDGCPNQFAVAIPMFDKKDFKLTLFTIIIEDNFPGWLKLDSAASRGHEIASHTMTHVSLQGLAESQQVYELKNSKDSINAHVPGRQCVTMAYPYCNQGTDALCARYYLSARTCSGQIVPKTPANFYAISSFGCGSQSSNNSTTALNALANNAVASNGWCVYLIHGIDNDGGYSPVSTATLQGCVDYMDANRDKFWVETFGNVTRYIKERNAASIKGIETTDDSITVKVSDTLNDTIFNYPITLRRRLPSGWQNVVVSQGGRAAAARIKDSAGIKYAIFDVVPDQGIVVISKNASGNRKPLVPIDRCSAERTMRFVINNTLFSIPAPSRPILDISLYSPIGALVGRRIIHRRDGEEVSGLLPAFSTASGLYIVKVTDRKSMVIQKCVVPPRNAAGGGMVTAAGGRVKPKDAPAL